MANEKILALLFYDKLEDKYRIGNDRKINGVVKMLEDFDSGVEDLQISEFLKEKLIHMALTRDVKVFKMVKKYFSLKDLIEIGRRMIGTGLIGGKSLGMLLAQAILINSSPDWGKKLEKHDSFFIGSDVFSSLMYCFLRC